MRALLCLDAHQDIYRLLGRDPVTHPLSPFDRALFFATVQDILVARNSSGAP